jgi:hypothetical protein
MSSDLKSDDPLAGREIVSKQVARRALGDICDATFYNLVKRRKLRLIPIPGTTRSGTPVEDIRALKAEALASAGHSIHQTGSGPPKTAA